jgi:PKD repeat protein
MMTGFGILAAGLAGCSISQTEEPPLQGPSELALAFSLQAIPDVLTQDGASQSQIVVQARDAKGQPARGVNFRADIMVGSTMTDFGSLSARDLVTDSAGRATLTYTAPRPVSGVSVDTGQQVAIRVTPLGTDFANSLPRTVTIRLIPPGVLLPGGPIPPAAPDPTFTFSPSSPTVFTDVAFDATSKWTPAPTTQLASFTWHFGDGSTDSGMQVVHQFKTDETFLVTLTVTDTNGVSTSVQRSVTVGPGTPPTADFVFSPTSPAVNQDILFNAGTSTAATGREIVAYNWNMGSGAPRTGRTFTKSYDVAGTYAVVLTVTDSAGQTGTTTKNVVVGAAAAVTASFTFSPTAPTVNQTVNFNGSGSTTPSGTTITSYAWDFGDGSTGTGSTTTHPYASAGTFIARLTVTNSAGQTAFTTQNVVVGSGPALTASFTFSPTNPSNGTTVNFNGTGSTTPSGTTITSYAWDFGDGATGSGATTSHAYAVTASRTFVVRLTITNSAGQTATTTQSVPVTFP